VLDPFEIEIRAVGIVGDPRRERVHHCLRCLGHGAIVAVAPTGLGRHGFRWQDRVPPGKMNRSCTVGPGVTEHQP
jgi:hypothetical protein